MATSNEEAVWAHFNEGGALNVDVVSRSEAEELSLRVTELEDEVSLPCRAALIARPTVTTVAFFFFCDPRNPFPRFVSPPLPSLPSFFLLFLVHPARATTCDRDTERERARERAHLDRTTIARARVVLT